MTAKEALIKLENLSVDITEDGSVPYGETIDYQIIYDALNRLEELDKVLKIIRDKRVDTRLLFLCNTVNEYNKYDEKELTETEFNLLKEYLK